MTGSTTSYDYYTYLTVNIIVLWAHAITNYGRLYAAASKIVTEHRYAITFLFFPSSKNVGNILN